MTTILDKEIPKDSERASCTQCGSVSHGIARCEEFDFLHPNDWDKDPERLMVIARRQAHHYGGIPEIYLHNPTPKQAAMAQAHQYEQDKKLRMAILNIEQKFTRPTK